MAKVRISHASSKHGIYIYIYIYNFSGYEVFIAPLRQMTKHRLLIKNFSITQR
jgi:hypothetical protein